MKRKLIHPPSMVATPSVDQNERIRRMRNYLERTRELFKLDLERSAHLGVAANGVLAGPTRNNTK